MPILSKLHLKDEASEKEIVVYINDKNQVFIQEEHEQPEYAFWFCLDIEDWQELAKFINQQLSNNG